MGNPFCHHIVVGTLLVHQGRVAVGMRQKPPLNRAPSAGHVDPEDGLPQGYPLVDVPDRVLRETAARELFEETGVRVDPDKLCPLVTSLADDRCHKSSAMGKPSGRHMWHVFGHDVGTISRPSLRDEPGGMVDWQWRSVPSLLADPETEPVWKPLLKLVLTGPFGSRFTLAD